MMAFPPTMEELHLHLVAVAPTTAAAVASEGRAVAAYLVSEGWRIRAAVDSVGLRLPHGSAERAETLPDVPAGSPFAHPSALLRLEPRSAERVAALLGFVRARGPELGAAGVAAFAHPHHAPAPPLAPAERGYLDFHLRARANRPPLPANYRQQWTLSAPADVAQTTARSGWSARTDSRAWRCRRSCGTSGPNRWGRPGSPRCRPRPPLRLRLRLRRRPQWLLRRRS